MTTTVSRRAVAKGAAWGAPIVLASSTIPAYAASQNKLGIQYGVYVSDQYNGGYVGYASSNNTGTTRPTSPTAYFASNPRPESDINWNDGTSRPTNSSMYVNGEGSFTPVTNSQTGQNGAYASSSGFWWSVPTTNTATGSDYISGSTATLAAGATFVTVVEFTVPAGAEWSVNNGTITNQAWNPKITKPLTGTTTELIASSTQATYLSIAQTAGTWTADIPTVTKNADGSSTFRGTITYKTTKAYTLTQSGTKYYGQTNFMPAQIKFSDSYGWISYSQTSYIQNATITYSGNGITDTLSLTGLSTTATLRP